MLVCLLVLTAVFLLLTLYDVLQANRDLFNITDSPFWSAHLLDTSTAANLFVAVLGALLVRHQFAIGLLPRIGYKSALTAKDKTEESGEACNTWRVEILNTGLGSAIINRIEYFIEMQGSKPGKRPQSFSGVIKELSSIQLTRGEDYRLEHITAGFSLSPKDTCFVFDIKTEHLHKLKRLVMVLYFQGQLGNKYRSEIFLTPRI